MFEFVCFSQIYVQVAADLIFFGMGYCGEGFCHSQNGNGQTQLELCDRYVVKKRGQHRDRCQSIGCAYSLLAEDGTELGCGWVCNITEHVDHPCAVLHDNRIFLLKKCHDYGVERIAEKDAVIA
jgi:hypothetical protein